MTKPEVLCGGGVPFSHPSLGLCVFFLSFTKPEARELQAATESDGLIAIRTRGAINTAAQIEHFTPLLQKHFGNVVSVQEGHHSFLGAKSDEKDGSILFKVKNENLACNLPGFSPNLAQLIQHGP